jgi:methylenetetrahydrofolate dehydrogenase (NADP+)/methenyltetrahydrofolate cyclohydrolase
VDRTRVVTGIAVEKDIDGITAASAARLSAGDLDGTLLPATAAAVIELLRAHQIEIHGRRAVVVGRSAVVGRPVAQLLALAGAHVEVVHSKTPDMGAVTRTAQILVVAAGVCALVRGEHVSPGCVVVDVGIHVQEDQIVGDVDEASVRDAVGETGALSPVPGGVGPMTNAILVLQAAQSALRLAGA